MRRAEGYLIPGEVSLISKLPRLCSQEWRGASWLQGVERKSRGTVRKTAGLGQEVNAKILEDSLVEISGLIVTILWKLKRPQNV